MSTTTATAAPVTTNDPWRYLQAKRSLLQGEVDAVNDQLQHYIDKKQNFSLTAEETAKVAELYDLRQHLQQQLRDLNPTVMMQQPDPFLALMTSSAPSSSTANDNDEGDDAVLLRDPQAPTKLLQLMASLHQDARRLHDELTETHVALERTLKETVMPTPEIVAKLTQRLRRMYRTTGDVVERHRSGNYDDVVALQLHVLRRLSQ